MLLTKFSQFLSKYTTPVVLIFAVVAFIYAPSFAWVKGDTQTIILGIIMIGLGTLSCLGYGPLSNVTIIGMQFLDFFDFLKNSVMMPIAAIAICIFVSIVVGLEKVEVEITKDGNSFKRKKIFNFMIQYLCPIFAFIILLSSIANEFGFISM